MARERGYAVWVNPDGPKVEMSTFTCCHCQALVFIKQKAPPEELGGFCRMCMKPTCPKCADGACAPFEKQLEAQEARDRSLRSMIGV